MMFLVLEMDQHHIQYKYSHRLQYHCLIDLTLNNKIADRNKTHVVILYY